MRVRGFFLLGFRDAEARQNVAILESLIRDSKSSLGGAVKAKPGTLQT